MTPLDAYYARLSDARDRGPQTYGGNTAVASLRCFMRYTPGSHVDFIDAFGTTRWLTHKQMRVHALLMRALVGHEGTTMRALADEALVCPSTVSRAILKFVAWGLFVVDVTRGRNGGIRVSETQGAFSAMAARAMAKLRELAAKARDRLVKLNVASPIPTKRGGEFYLDFREYDAAKEEYEKTKARTKELLLTVDATFSATVAWLAMPEPQKRFVSGVLAERKRLDIVDPE